MKYSKLCHVLFQVKWSFLDFIAHAGKDLLRICALLLFNMLFIVRNNYLNIFKDITRRLVPQSCCMTADSLSAGSNNS